MSGWSILIAQESPAIRDANPDKRAAVMVSWETGPNGIAWLKELDATGKAALVHLGGYPTRYAAFACDVLPLLGIALQQAWENTVHIDGTRVTSCSHGDLITIDVWDLS